MAGDGESVRDRLDVLHRAVDWTRTGLGPPRDWPRELRAVLRVMLGSQQQMVLFWGPDQLVLYNAAYAAMIGDNHPTTLGRPAGQHWGDLRGLLDQVRFSGKSFVGRDHSFPIVRRGFLEQTYVDLCCDPVCDEDDDSVAGVLCLLTETTARVLSERRLRTLSELASSTAQLSTVVEVASAAGTALAGSPDDLPAVEIYLGATLESLHLVASAPAAAESAPHPRPGLASAFELGRPVDLAAHYFPAAEAPSAAVVLPLDSAAGPLGVLVAAVNPMLELNAPYREFLDLIAGVIATAIVNAATHQRERRRAESLSELDRAKTDLFVHVSHELRTPLTLVSAPAEEALSDEDEPLPPRQRERMRLIRRNSARLRRLLNNVLDFTKIEGGGLRPERVATDLAAFTRAIAASFAPAISRGGLEFVVRAADLDRVVHVDRSMWERIVLNLLSNALKFTWEGQITLTLTGGAEHVRLSVTDTGIGIADGDVPHLFRQFHRVRGAGGRTEEGAGIGLALVHELVVLHDGTITVDTRLGQGSTFTVRIPYGSGAASRTHPEPDWVREVHLAEALGWPTDTGRSSELPIPPGHTVGATVLVVEDNADLRGYLQQLLSPHWKVWTARDASTALDLIAMRRPDLVLSDVTLPSNDRFALLEQLRGNPDTQDIPVILLSGEAGEQAAVAALQAGADDYLVKPFSSLQLQARVRSNIELARLRGQQVEREATQARFAAHLAAATDVEEVLLIGGAELCTPWPGAAAAVVGWEDDEPLVLAPRNGPPWAELPAAAQAAFAQLRVIPGAVRSTWVNERGRQAGGLAGVVDVLGEPVAVWLGFAAPVPVSGADRNLFEAMCGQLGLALSRATSFDRQRTVALTLQRSILGPTTLPEGFAVRYEPAVRPLEVGGDWYDVITLGVDRVGLVVGDCVGRGLSAAAVMGQLRSACRALLLRANSPARTLRSLDDFAASVTGAACTTVLCAVVDLRTGELTYSSAGHPPAMLARPDGHVTPLTGANALPLAVQPPVDRPEATIVMTEGSTMLFYTDGLVERRDESIDQGIQRAADALADGHTLPEQALADRLLRGLMPTAEHDDVAVLVYRHGIRPGRFTRSFPADPAELRPARQALREWLAARSISAELTEKALLCAVEAWSNSIEHGYLLDPGRVVHTSALLHESHLEIVVVDTGRWRTPEEGGRPTGRGISIMRAVAENVSVDTGPAGTVVRTEFKLVSADAG